MLVIDIVSLNVALGVFMIGIPEIFGIPKEEYIEKRRTENEILIRKRLNK